MTRVKNVLVGLAIFGGSALLPAKPADAALFDCLRRVFYVPTTYCVPTVATVATCAPACPPVVEQRAYSVPCAVPAVPVVPTTVCSTTYIRRTYLEPRVSYVTHAALEAEPRYVRRYYWDPVLCRYRTQLEPYTAYVKRYYQVPVTSYVVRSYLQPVTTCTTPACPAPVCPAPACPAPACPAPASPPANAASQAETAASQPAATAGTGAEQATGAVAKQAEQPKSESPWEQLDSQRAEPVSRPVEPSEQDRALKAALLVTAVANRA